jgi:cytochrome c oxidase subunit 4
MAEQTAEHALKHNVPAEQHATGEGHAHTQGYGTYFMVWLGLVAFTAVTVTIAGLNLGSVTLITALVIASVKSFLVITYFMHVKNDSAILKVFIGICLLVFVIIMVLTFSDLSFR